MDAFFKYFRPSPIVEEERLVIITRTINNHVVIMFVVGSHVFEIKAANEGVKGSLVDGFPMCLHLNEFGGFGIEGDESKMD